MPNHENNIKLHPLPGFWSNIHAGFFLTLLILGFMTAIIWSKINTVRLSAYEVLEGSLMPQSEYRGLILREEAVINASAAGTFYRYAREGERVASGQLVYIIDRNGSIKEYLKNTEFETNVENEPDYEGLRDEITGFNKKFNPRNFSDTYDLYYNLQGFAHSNASRILEGAGERIRAAADGAEFGYAGQSGIVVYHCDGYEGVSTENITYKDVEILEDAEDLSVPVANETPVEPGRGVYKLITSEDWSVIISVDWRTYDALIQKGFVNVTFSKNGQAFLAAVSDSGLPPVQDAYMIRLDLYDGMAIYATQRIINVELDIEQKKGLKIPKSAILSRDFFIIPKDLVFDAGGEIKFVHSETIDENGKPLIQEQTISIYSEDEDNYYTDDVLLSPGDTIVANGETYRIGETKLLTGVFNVNRGFAEFKEIVILDEDDLYAIVTSNTNYGLRVHDHIALKASDVKEGELIKRRLK